MSAKEGRLEYEEATYDSIKVILVLLLELLKLNVGQDLSSTRQGNVL